MQAIIYILWNSKNTFFLYSVYYKVIKLRYLFSTVSINELYLIYIIFFFFLCKQFTNLLSVFLQGLRKIRFKILNNHRNFFNIACVWLAYETLLLLLLLLFTLFQPSNSEKVYFSTAYFDFNEYRGDNGFSPSAGYYTVTVQIEHKRLHALHTNYWSRTIAVLRNFTQNNNIDYCLNHWILVQTLYFKLRPCNIDAPSSRNEQISLRNIN